MDREDLFLMPEEKHVDHLFVVFDEDNRQSVVFDATNVTMWGPVVDDLIGDLGNYRLWEWLYRHHSSGHWTRVSETTHEEPPHSNGKRACRYDDSKALVWLVRNGFGLPNEVAHLADRAFFVPGQPKDAQPEAADKILPKWNKARGELTYNGTIIKQISRITVATNSVRLLDAFQEEGWPDRIDDPLAPSKDQQRLHEAIKRLNGNLHAIRFHADGTGQGIKWEVTATEPPPGAT